MAQYSTFRAPTVIFGQGAVTQIGEIAASLGTKVLVVSGAQSASSTGTLTRIEEALAKSGVQAYVLPAATTEPTDRMVDALREAIAKEGCSAVVGVGGGSALDAAKAAAGLYYSEASTHLHMAGKAPIPKTGLPWIGVPTTAGSGAEVTPNAVLTDLTTGVKKSLRSWSWLATAAIVDPELTVTMPPAVTASSGMDALTQAIESFTSRGATPLTDSISLRAAEQVGRHLLRAYTHPNDLQAREAVAWGSMMAGIALANARLGAVHAFAHPVGTHCHLGHGSACAILLPSVMEFNTPVVGEKYAYLAEVLGLTPPGASSEQGSAALITFVRDLARKLGLAERLGDVGLRPDMIPSIIEQTLPSGSLAANPRPATPDQLAEILRSHLR